MDHRIWSTLKTSLNWKLKLKKVCHPHLDPKAFYEECLLDYCENESDSEICGIFESYVTTCQSFLPADSDLLCEWQDEVGCSPSCGLNQKWKGCAKPCADKEVCFESNPTFRCPEFEQNRPMCICKPGFILNESGQCVTPDQCGCKLDNGIVVGNGWQQTSSDCTEICSCHNSVLNCVSQVGFQSI